MHFYSPVPDTQSLKLDDQTRKFIAADEAQVDAACAALNELAYEYETEFSAIASRPRYGNGEEISEFRFGKAPYTTLEAELLYGLIRKQKPSQIIEIGCGHTTLLMAEAIRMEPDYAPKLECIEPYRPEYLSHLPAEVTSFRDEPIQSVPLERFSLLEAGDILFIDSSHVVSYDSDTVHEITRILPTLKPGVLVHFHDIFLPYDYPNEWLQDSKFFWTEQYMLAAMLNGNARYKILYPLHQVYRERRESMQDLFPLLSEAHHRPGAFWITVV